ncbi:MAG: hypothetical protein ACREL1_08730 [bacterium]
MARLIFILVFVVIGFGFQNLYAGDFSAPLLRGQLTFYDDQEEFNSPFYPNAALEGIQLQSTWTASTGNFTGFQAGVFIDDRDPNAAGVEIKPLLSFEYHREGTRLIMGTLENQNRHGFLAPLENETLELTRPVEYGFQWIEKDEGFQSDLFLDWQQVDQPGQDEIFDYGGVLTTALAPGAVVQMQFHGYHEGGRIFNLRVVNNYNPALGIKLSGDLGSMGSGGLNLFAVGSSDFEGKFETGPDWGRAIYAQAWMKPGNQVELYGIYWNAQDFFSEEGDPNYNSQGQDADFYRSNRVYVEAGLKKELRLGGGIRLDAEAKSGWADEFWGWSFHLTARVPFAFDLPFVGQTTHRNEGPDAL